jgi:hypothetical protein
MDLTGFMWKTNVNLVPRGDVVEKQVSPLRSSR